LEGEPVAVGKVTVLNPGEVWLEGLRVSPEHRRHGLAYAYMAGQRPFLARLRPRVIRLATGSHNVAVHHMMEKGHFQHVASYAHFRAEADATVEAPPLETLGPADAPAIWAILDGSEAFAAGHRLYAAGWRWPKLTESRLAQHLQAGEVVGFRHAGDAISALAVTPHAHDFYEERGRLWAGLLEREPRTVTELARALQRRAADLPDREVVAFVPEDSAWPAALKEAGYTEEEMMGFWIFEREVHRN